MSIVLVSFKNKIGTRQATWAVWSTFAKIHSTYPGAIDALFGLVEFPVRIFVTHTSKHTQDLPNLSYDCDL